MSPRLDPFTVAPALMKPYVAFSDAVAKSGLESSLQELVKMRASQINGCAFCLDMHSHDARRHGETEQRLYLLDAWRDSSLYSDRERAALAWTECLTLVAKKRAPDDDYATLQQHFTEDEQVALTMLIVAINGWNRVQVGFHAAHPVRKQPA